MQKPIIRGKTLASILTLALFTGCDIVKDDISPSELSTELYTFAEKPAVVNLSIISGGNDVDVRDLNGPLFGDYQVLSDKKGSKFLIYTPNQSFKGQKEELGMNLVNSTTKDPFGRLKVGIESLDNGRGTCKKASGIYDYAKITSDSTLVIDLLDNDIFCGVGYNGGAVQDHYVQNSENVILSLGPGRIVTLTYTPPPGFTGKVLYIYDLGINWLSPDNVEFFEGLWKDPAKYLEAYTTSMVEIDVVAK